MPDQFLPQPPPDAPAPPPSEAALLSRRKMKWLVGIGLIAMTIALFFGSVLFWQYDRMKRHGRGHDQVEAINNARQIGIALFEFETEYGKFPDASTVADVKRESGTPLTLAGNTSNDHFAQLIASGIAQSEHMFYARAKGAVKPDGVFDSDATVISHGECGFAYIAGMDATGDPSTPIVFGPVMPGTRTLDAKVYDGKAVVLKKDNSATRLPINSAGKIVYNGMDLLDPRQPFWNGKAPDVKWPK